MENIDFYTIMHDITAGLTGDPQKDMTYLKEQEDKYREHELSTEILCGCGRLMYELIPGDGKEKFERLIRNEHLGIEETLDEVRFNIYKKNYDKALKIMEALVSKIEKLNVFQNDRVSEYYVFDETFEEVLYQYREKPKKELRRAQIPYPDIYFLYGSLLVELNCIQEAQSSLKKGLQWNPVSFAIMAEYMETYKMMGDFDKFFSITLETFKIAFRSKDVARCYRNLGYYFVEKELYEEATACYLLSMQYDNGSKQPQSELYFINATTKAEIKAPSLEEVKKYAEKYGFPMGPNPEVAGLAFTYGEHCLKEGLSQGARYFLNIFYDLTNDEEIKEMLEKIPEDDGGVKEGNICF
ncbi:MAG: hypothetical protein Q4C25_02265 [Bacillota bacterium]|nr:hypothetical protein [Bacillota bacterium]